MNIQSHSESRSEISATPEPWHRGSTFTWLLLGLAGAVFFLSGAVLKAQTIYDWGDGAPDGNWTQGAGGARWWAGGLWNAPDPGNVLRFNNNHQTTMQNNVSGTYNIHGLIFGSSATTGRTIGGNAIRLFDSSGTDPYIENSSSATHSINIAVSADGDSADPLKINFNGTGGLTFGSTFNNQGGTVEIAGSNTGSKTLLFSGVVSGSGGMYINNNGVTVNFDAANTQSGQLTINAGTARLVGSGDTFGGSGQAVRIGSGATLNLNGVSTTVGSVGEEGNGDSGSISLGAGTLTIGGSATTFQGSISGTGGITHSGSGSLALHSTQSYTGTTTVSAGTLSSSVAMASTSYDLSGGTFSTTAANVISDTASVTLRGGTLSIGGNEAFGNNGLSLSSSSIVSVGSGSTASVSGAVTGAGGLTKSGSGSLALTGANTYSGGTTISGGTLVGNTTSIQGAVANNAALELSQNTDGTYSGALSGAGTLVKKGTGNITLGSSNSGYSGGVYIDAGTLSAGEGAGFGAGSVFLGQDGVSSTATVAIGDANGGTSVANDVVVRAGGGTRTITSANSSGSNTFSGNVYLDGAVSLSSSVGGRLILSGRLDDGLGAGNFTATITAGSVEFAGSSSNQNLTSYTVNSGAELRMNKSSADAVQSILNIDAGGTATLAAANQLGSGATVNNSGTLATGGNSDTFGTLNSSGNITGTGTLTASTYNLSGGTISANLGNGTLNTSGNSTINGNTTASSLNVTGDTTLNGTSSATTVAVSGSGTDLNLGSGGNRLSSSADVTVAANSRLNITSNQTLASVKEAGSSNGGQVDIGSGAKLTINGADKGNLFQNTISGAGDLEMAGSGNTALALYGTQSYTGNTTVSGGKISTAVALATAGVTVSGGTFETTAADILGNSASVNISSGTYSLGGNDSVGSLTISGGSLTGSSTLTAATYALQGGTVGANLGAGAATASSGTTALNGNLGGSLTASGGTVNTAGTIGGNVTVSGGTVNLNGADRISNTSAVSISSGTLGMGANNDTVGSFNISGGTLGGTGKLTTTTYGLSGGTVNANLGAGTVNANSGTTSLNGTVDATTVNVGGGTLNLGSGGRLAAGTTANVTSGTLSTGGNETITRLNATGGTVNLTDDTLTVTGTGGNASSIGAGAEMVGGTIAIGTASANSGRMTINSLDADNTSALSIASGGTLTGSFRTSGALSLDGVFAPGNSTGISYVGATTFLGGGRYQWEVDTFGLGAAVGTNWDFLDISGGLTISATSGDKFWIDIISLLASNDQTGEASGFNLTSNYSFAIATAAGGISGFNAGAFGINSEGFLNSVGAGDPLYVSAGSWSVSQQGNSLMLNYSGATAIPEPSSAALTLLGMGVLALRRRYRR